MWGRIAEQEDRTPSKEGAGRGAFGMQANSHLLVVDDEELIRWSLGEFFRTQGYRVSEACNGEEALRAMVEDPPDAMILDLKMPVMDGRAVLEHMRQHDVLVPVLVLTADASVQVAVQATQLGAADYLTKPFDLLQVKERVEKLMEEAKARRTVASAADPQTSTGYGAFIGRSQVLQPVYGTLGRLERVDAPTVLITGESGTGKDVIARMIHQRGPRAKFPFLEVDCAALPANLIESELFGHERGAFTDAKSLKRGLFEVARGGVVFLDELGELPIETQAKLLRALENRSYRRVGGTQTLQLDAALVAATNRDLKAEVEKGTFREDLYFRLNVVPVHLPPLRARRDDIPLLTEHLLDMLGRRLGRRVEGLTEEAMALLQRWRWPGNVRELRNTLERALILGDGAVITGEDLPNHVRFCGEEEACEPEVARGIVLPEEGCDLEEVERTLIEQALQRTAGNQSAAARLLGLSRYALRYRMEKHGLLGQKAHA